MVICFPAKDVKISLKIRVIVEIINIISMKRNDIPGTNVMTCLHVRTSILKQKWVKF